MDFGTSLNLVILIISYILLAKWLTEKTGSKVIGIIAGTIIIYLTIYSHPEWMFLAGIFIVFYVFWGPIETTFKNIGSVINLMFGEEKNDKK